MFFSGNTGSRAGTPRAALIVLGAAALLAACHHDSNTITKGLWIANGNNVVEFVPSQLTGGVVDVAPKVIDGSGSLGTPQGVTFDKSGNLWVMDPGALIDGTGTPALLEFSSAQVMALGTTNSPEPTAIITSDALAFPQQSVFDSAGNQWVSDHNNNTILVFTAAQLAMTGTNNLTPAVVMSSSAFNGPLGIVFDSSGNLWVANNGGVPVAGSTTGAMSATGTSIVEFAKANLPTVQSSGQVTPALNPDITLNDDGANSIQAPWELAFDSSGNLWSSNSATPFTLVEFAKSMLAASGSPTPMTTISPVSDGGTETLNATNGLCFDNLGDIAATNAINPPASAPFYKTPLKSGMITPSTFLSGATTTLNMPAGCNWGPLVN